MLVAVADCMRAEASTVEIELPSSTRRCSPVAVVTTSASFTIARSSTKSAAAVCPDATLTLFFCSSNPTRRTRTSHVPAGTLRMVYRPSAAVVPNRVVPTTTTRTSESGCVDSRADTRPAIVPCAKAVAAVAPTSKSAIDVCPRRRRKRTDTEGRGIVTSW